MNDDYLIQGLQPSLRSIDRVRRGWEYTCFIPHAAAGGIDAFIGQDFPGVVGCDRAKMYLLRARIQWCWAHLLRDFQALTDSTDSQAKRLGHELQRPVHSMFARGHQVRDDTLSRRAFQQQMQPIRLEVEAGLLRGLFSGDVRRTASRLRQLVDLRGLGARRADEQLPRTRVTSSRDLAETLLRHSMRRRQPFRGNDSHRPRNLPSDKTKLLRLRHSISHRTFSGHPQPKLLTGAGTITKTLQDSLSRKSLMTDRARSTPRASTKKSPGPATRG